MGLEDGFDDFNPDDYGIDTSQWLGGEPLPSSVLPSSDLFSGAADLPTGLDSYSDPNGGAIQQFLKMLHAGGGQSQPSGRGQLPTGLADLASTVGAFSSGEKANRYMKGLFTQNYDRSMLEAQTGRNENESDALKKLAQTAYIKGGGSNFKPPSLSLNGKSYQTPDLGFGPPPVSDAEKAGASTLQDQLQARLMPGGSYTPQPLSDYAEPGTAEKLASYGSSGLSGASSILSMLNHGGGDGQSDPSSIGSIVQSLAHDGKSVGEIAKFLSNSGILNSGGAEAAAAAARAASGGSMVAGSGMPSAAGNILGAVGKYAGPIAGAALGTYGLAKNASVGSDVMSGAGAGASIGSLGGPIGTAVGAGVGALVGALRGAFSVTGKEQGGRDAQAQITQNLSKLATPQQIADSKKAGWPDPNQALALIVMRDKLTHSGVPGPQAEAQAESIMHGMWDGEKGGAQDVIQASNPIQQMMARNSTPYTNPFSQISPSLTGNSPYPAGTDAFSRGAYKG